MHEGNLFESKHTVKCCTKSQTKHGFQLIGLSVFLVTLLVISNTAFAQSSGTLSCGGETCTCTPVCVNNYCTCPPGSTVCVQGPPCPSVSTSASINPNSGSTTGGYSAVISGTGFSTAGITGVYFNGIKAQISSITSTAITVVVPKANSGGTVFVYIYTKYNQPLMTSFTYNAPLLPTITSVYPDSGSTAGGTKVTIYGTNLIYVKLPVYFGEGELTDVFTSSDGKTIIGVTPAGTEGSAEIIVYTNGGRAVADGKYTYLNPVTLASVSSNKGPLTGGTIQININDPDPNNEVASVDFESTPATIDSQSVNGDTREAVITVPPSQLQTRVPVTITMNDGTVLSFQYEYTEGPVTAATLKDSDGNSYTAGSPTTASEIDAELTCVPSTESEAACSDTYFCMGQGGTCTPNPNEPSDLDLYTPGSKLVLEPSNQYPLPQHVFLCFYSTDTDGINGSTQCDFVDFEPSASTLPTVSVTGTTTLNNKPVPYDFGPQISQNEVDMSFEMNPQDSKYEIAVCIIPPGNTLCVPRLVPSSGGLSAMTLNLKNPQEIVTSSSFTLPASNFVEYTSSIPITMPGTSLVAYGLYNVSGSKMVRGSFSSVEVIIQPAAPVTLASATSSSGNYAFGTWTKSSFVNVLLKCTPQTAGATSCGIRYCTYTGFACTPSGEFSDSAEVTVPFSEGGISHINYEAQDDLGNTEQTETQSIQIDNTPPATAATARTSSGAGYTFGTSVAYSYVAVSLSCSDSDSGCGATLYCTDTTNTCTPNLIYSSPITISAPMTSYIRFFSADLAGNIENVNSRKIVLGAGSLCGSSCPTGQVLSSNCNCVAGNGPVTIASAKTSSNANYTFGTPSSAPFVNVYLSCSDSNGPGCDATSYCADSANACIPSNIYSSSAPIQIASIGTSYIRYRSNDTAGNLENIKSGGVIINGTLYSCPNTCVANQTQVPYPNCACVYLQLNNTCTNTCLSNQTQMTYPDCKCITNVLPTPNATCLNSCSSNQTQLSYPDCRCLMSTCTNTCSANETQAPPPDCNCISQQVNFSDYCLSTCSLRGCSADKCQAVCVYQGDQFLSACNNICQSTGGSYLVCSLECGVAQNEINKASDCYSNCTLNSSAYSCGQICGINDYITVVGGCAGSNVTITSVTPSNGSTEGGNNVVITGTGLNGTMAVTLGITSASIVSVSPTQVIITSPVHPVGTVDVTAVTPLGTAIDSNSYTYYTPPQCIPNWQCSDWDTCSDGTETRVCSDANSCGNTTNKPSTSRSCTVACVPSWNCTDSSWGICSNGLQMNTQTCVDSNKCNSPYMIQSNRTCSLNCTSNWNCIDNGWNDCSNGLQTETQTCVDLNNCTSPYTAAKSQPCSNVIPPISGSVVVDGKVIPPSSRPQETVVKQRQAIFTQLASNGKWVAASVSTCIRGASCDTSDDCCGAPCSGGYCLCNVKSCNSSGECCNGYCDNGECRSPATSVYLFSNPTQGCSGLIDECLPGEGGCLVVCDGLSILMLISSIGAGIVAWTKYKHPVSGIVTAVVPIIMGMMLYTFVGVIISIAIIAMLTLIKTNMQLMSTSTNAKEVKEKPAQADKQKSSGKQKMTEGKDETE